ncbi:MAG: hypothetical protein KKB50_19125, partial [Planctomycetes bacterium]|nr:hypothetical protein [Planctomycetota bacterium]
VRRFVGVDPAPMSCVSATLHLPLPRHDITAADVAAGRRRNRDICYNPQRYLRAGPRELLERRTELIRQSAALRAGQQWNRSARRAVFGRIRQVNAQILQCEPKRVKELARDVEMLESQWQQNRTALDRAYFFALHPLASLRGLVDRIRAEIEAS